MCIVAKLEKAEGGAAQVLKVAPKMVSILEGAMHAMKKDPDKFRLKLSPQMAKLMKGLLGLDALDDEVCP